MSIPSISLEGTTPASEQIQHQLRGFISSGLLGAGERLPPVRQLAVDLNVAAGTVAKAYKALEAAGLLETRIGAGTRVRAGATATPAAVLEQARTLVDASKNQGISQDDVLGLIRALWNL